MAKERAAFDAAMRMADRDPRITRPKLEDYGLTEADLAVDAQTDPQAAEIYERALAMWEKQDDARVGRGPMPKLEDYAHLQPAPTTPAEPPTPLAAASADAVKESLRRMQQSDAAARGLDLPTDPAQHHEGAHP